MAKKKTGKVEVIDVIDDLSYLDKGSKEQEAVITEMVEKSSKEGDKIVVQYGESPWRLLTAVRNVTESSRTLVHGMEVPGGVLVRNTDYRGAGMVSSSMVLVPKAGMDKDGEDIDLYKLV